jgi:hypothetical protein
VLLVDTVPEQEPASLIGAVDLETLVGTPVPGCQAEVVEHRSHVEQLRVEAQSLLPTAQRAEQVHPAGMLEDQRGGRLADQLDGLGHQPSVRDVDVGNALAHRRTFRSGCDSAALPCSQSG